MPASQRLRLCFARRGDLRHISHLDMVRCWERALRRAGVPLAYSQGFTPHPRISFASPLPVGVVGLVELLDVFLSLRMAAEGFARALSGQLPDGLELLGVEEVSPDEPSLQERLAWADYRVGVRLAASEVEGLERAVAVLLNSPAIVVTRSSLGAWPGRPTGQGAVQARPFDLRTMLLSLSCSAAGPDEAVLAMRLRAGQQGSARPEEVLRALGLPDNALLWVERSALGLGELRAATLGGRQEGSR